MKRMFLIILIAQLSFCLLGNYDTTLARLPEITDLHRINSIAVLGQENNRFNASMLDTITELYTQIAALPIPEILDLLEEIVAQFDEFSTDYELNNSTLSWQQWIEKYWWMPPVVFAACIVLILRYKKLSDRATI